MPSDASESLTLDMGARTRAADALSDAIEQGYRNHYCDEWDEGDGCTICWDHAAAVIRAAEGLSECARCSGSGDIGGGATVCCPECGGNGLQAREDAPIHTTENGGPMSGLTDEHYRILRAAADGLLWTNKAGRCSVADQDWSERKAREQLKARGLIDYATHTSTGRTDYRRLVITDKGREALR